jgi:hypothetical protein
LIELNTAKEREISALNELKWENHKLEEDLRNLSREIDQLREKSLDVGQIEEQPLDPKSQKMAQWYTEAKSILEKVTGMGVHRLAEGIIEMEYRDRISRDESIGRLSLVIIPGSYRLIDAKAYYNGNILVPVDDLLQYTQKYEDLRFLVMETMFRLENYHLRQKEFDEITRCGHEVNFESSVQGVDITIGNFESDDQFEFFVDHAYPRDTGSLQLKQVRYSSSRSRGDLSSCQVIIGDIIVTIFIREYRCKF